MLNFCCRNSINSSTLRQDSLISWTRATSRKTSSWAFRLPSPSPTSKPSYPEWLDRKYLQSLRSSAAWAAAVWAAYSEGRLDHHQAGPAAQGRKPNRHLMTPAAEAVQLALAVLAAFFHPCFAFPVHFCHHRSAVEHRLRTPIPPRRLTMIFKSHKNFITPSEPWTLRHSQQNFSASITSFILVAVISSLPFLLSILSFHKFM